MKKIMSGISKVLKESASEIKANWKFSQCVQERGKRIKVYVLIYMNIGFFLVYASLCFISILYILFGFIGGAVLGLKESPYYFFLFLLPVAALPFLYFVHNMWTSHYPIFKGEYFKKHSIQIPYED
ncbi:hypothetical protein FITA111629_11240 [Filibacter tadaridae]|uniref:Transmembrane protein n=1 Tax=Filibacter tadaridae TaxID=2483811 RepID=A0A3P5WUU8_9BACL|nr:hypothetical protein [Filibacter tadaridae]VDC25122.1 hypothetical protein FILTAD_01175 [Filibacter tadaridae]